MLLNKREGGKAVGSMHFNNREGGGFLYSSLVYVKPIPFFHRSSETDTYRSPGWKEDLSTPLPAPNMLVPLESPWFKGPASSISARRA